MNIEPLDVPDAWLCTPRVFGDDRGMFLEWFRGDLLAAATGRRFDVVQANHSVSRRGVVRGIHYAAVPPGQAKFVYCPVGSALDVVVDLRIGSPSFGSYDTVVLDGTDRNGVMISEGLGHAFCALEDNTSLTYLTTSAYDPSAEFAITPLDRDLQIEWPSLDLILSDRDRAAPTLAEATELGNLPTLDACAALGGIDP